MDEIGEKMRHHESDYLLERRKVYRRWTAISIIIDEQVEDSLGGASRGNQSEKIVAGVAVERKGAGRRKRKYSRCALSAGVQRGIAARSI